MGRYSTNTAWLPSTGEQSFLLPGLSVSAINTTSLNSIISRRENFVETMISKRYTLPLTQTGIITHIVENMVTYDIGIMLQARDAGFVQNETIVDQYNQSLDILKQIRDRELNLVDSTGALIPEKSLASKYYVSSRNYSPTFDEGSAMNWAVSPTKLNDIDTTRSNDVG